MYNELLAEALQSLTALQALVAQLADTIAGLTEWAGVIDGM